VDESGTDLIEFLCARLCHDLAGPLGAVASGVELLGDDPDPEIASLIATSASAAIARLRLLRAALGPSGPVRTGQEVQAVARAYLEAAVPLPFELIWPDATKEIDGRRARIALTLIMVARDALPRGGTIRVTVAPGASGVGGLSIGFAGDGAELGVETQRILEGQMPPSGPRTAPASWAARLVAQAKGAITVEIGENRGMMAT